jgi:hypothetical protein
MNFENFDLNKIKDLSPKDAKSYIEKYFIPLSSGDHAFLENGKYVIKDDAIIKRTYFKRLPKELYYYYFEIKTDLKTITYDINKPIFFDNYLNLCPKIIHQYKPYKEFSQDIQNKVNIMLNHLKTVLCSNDNDSYEYLMKWFSNMIQGNKNDSCLYLKSGQGTGKSTYVDFIRDFVIGKELSVLCGSGPFKTRFNSELSGKLMVQLEELENTSASEWTCISSVLKRQITSDVIMIEAKGKDTVEERNLNNYIIMSNNDAIRDDDGRRYFILDISTEKVGDLKYFENIRLNCYSLEVGHAFYCYLKEIDIKSFYAQNYPTTQAKKDSYCKRLDNVFQFLKERYLFQKVGFSGAVSDTYVIYSEYVRVMNLGKIKHKIDFNKTLKEIGISYYKSNSQNMYKVSYDELLEIAKKNKWIHQLELENIEEETEPEKIEEEESEEKEIDEIEELKKQIEELKSKNKKLKKKLKHYEN